MQMLKFEMDVVMFVVPVKTEFWARPVEVAKGCGGEEKGCFFHGLNGAGSNSENSCPTSLKGYQSPRFRRIGRFLAGEGGKTGAPNAQVAPTQSLNFHHSTFNYVFRSDTPWLCLFALGPSPVATTQTERFLP
jgi:hypothetical protein